MGDEWTTVYKWRPVPRFRDRKEAEQLYRDYNRISGAIPCILVDEDQLDSLEFVI
jgi:hypothetical protein